MSLTVKDNVQCGQTPAMPKSRHEAAQCSDFQTTALREENRFNHEGTKHTEGVHEVSAGRDAKWIDS
jgi:hypothetical protein